MTGFMQVMARQDAIPLAIASGCDMILFAADLQEDRDYIYKGLERGVLTEQRLDEAVTRILALKARLGLHRKMATGTLFPPDNAINVFADGTNRQLAAECADCSVTLVKDTQWLLPISPVRHKRVLLHILGDQGGYHDPIKNTSDHFCARLSAEGFDITRFDPQDISLRPIGNSVKSMTDRFDLIIYYCSVKTSASDNVARIVWDHPGGCNTPRYIHEIPTLFISIDSPYMLFDAPVVKTYINGYTPSQYVIDAIVEKILGRSEFKGTSPVDPFCGLLNARF
ncbi:MAG TPA: hypothetical protein DCM45_01740 [Clostridiales bacterium]|nr:hypothetical protein [Clostridiales bacterium]